jgi:hypothetical protein
MFCLGLRLTRNVRADRRGPELRSAGRGVNWRQRRLVTTIRRIRYNGVDLPYRTFDKRPQVNQAAIVENKRLGPILAYIAEQQKELDMSRSAKAPRRRGQKNHMFKVG